MRSTLPTPESFFIALGNAYKDDEILRIGGLLGELHAEQAAALRALTLCEIYRECASFHSRQNYDHRIRGTSQTVMSRREPSPVSHPLPTHAPTRSRSGNVRMAPGGNQLVPHAVFTRQHLIDKIRTLATQELIQIFRCAPSALPGYLQDRFEISVNSTKLLDDIRHLSLNRMDQAERARCRITFRSGTAYMLRTRGDTVEEVPADTRSNTKTQDLLTARIWCFSYVFTQEGIFMSDHREQHGSFRHTSYFDEGFVLCAGDIGFTDGRLTSISNLSGHYQPKPQQLLTVIQYLKRCHVPLEKVCVFLNSDGSLKELSALSPDEPAKNFYFEDDEVVQRTVPEFLEDPDCLPAPRRVRHRRSALTQSQVADARHQVAHNFFVQEKSL